MSANTAFNQIFSSQITTRIFESNKFLELIPNYSEFLNARTVNIPNTLNYGAGITIDSTISDLNDFVQTQEQYTTFTINNYRIKPVLVENFDEAITSYDKMAFTVKESLNQLSDAVSKRVLNTLSSDVDSTRKIFTSGESGVAGFHGESYKAVTWKDIVNIKKAFDADVVGEENRVLIIDEQFYSELLLNEGIYKQMNFNVQTEGIAKTGAIAQLAGINIIMKPTIAAAQASTSGDGIIPYSYSATRNFAAGTRRVGIAMQLDQLALAMAKPKIYATPDFALGYGNFISAEIAMGVKNRRFSQDNKGVYLLIQS